MVLDPKLCRLVLTADTCPICDGKIVMHAKADLTLCEFQAPEEDSDKSPLIRIVHGHCMRDKVAADLGGGKSGIQKGSD